MHTQEQVAQLSPIKQALIKIKELQAKLDHLETAQCEPIAVVGMGCRFPGDVDTPVDYWELLRSGTSAIGEIPWQRWKIERNHASTSTIVAQTVVDRVPPQRGHFLRDVSLFDAHFFGIAPREALAMDPQQQLLLEVSIEALEHANLPIDSLLGSRTGVYIGLMNQDYLQTQRSAEELDVYCATGSEMSFLVGRLSYLLGLRGPSMTVGTACSSSLVTTHLACHALRAKECDLALSGGVSLILTPESHELLSNMQATAPDGLSKTFDATADGFGRGEGCGILALKRLSDAQRDGDTIWAVIRGSAVNHDGRSGGLTVPSGPAQEELLRQALTAARVDASAVSYIEAHGTGTALGDPIEIRALGNVFCKSRQTPLFIGSAKTNIGHLEPAAGVAGLMKVILALRHKEIPPHLHFQQPNPHIPWQQYPIQIPTKLTEWSSDTPRMAGVSSFGLSGINAHIILEEAPVPAIQNHFEHPTRLGATNAINHAAIQTRPLQLLTLSAKTPQALQALVARYRDLCISQPAIDLGDLCYTAHIGRSHYSHRLSIVAGSFVEIEQKLSAYIANHEAIDTSQTSISPQQAPVKVAFLFTGQGAQYVNMGRELYESQPTFRQIIDHCDELIQAQLSESILKVLYPAKSIGADEASKIDNTTYTQPALFVLEYALATLWQSWGIEPETLIGHSVGEVVAACVAGVFSLEDGLKLIAARGRLMGALPQDGEMLSVMSDEAHVQQGIAPYPNEVSIAALNGPESVVISGKRETVLKIAEQFAAEGVKTRKLTVSHAFHSPLMEPMLADFRQVAASITYHKPKLRLVSNVTGKLAGDEITTPDYWVRHVRQAVRFADGVQTLHQQGIGIFLEIGPKPVLLGMAEQGASSKGQVPEVNLPPATCNLPSLREGQNDWQQMLTSLGELYVRGVRIDWVGFDRDYQRRKIVLPTYPFQRQRYWVDAPKKKPSSALRPLIDKLTRLPLHQETVFESEWNVAGLPFLADHRVYGRVVSPGACQLAMVLSAAEVTFGKDRLLEMEDVVLPQALVFADVAGVPGSRIVQVALQPATTNGRGPKSGSKQAFKFISFDPLHPEGTEAVEVATHGTGYVAATTSGQPDRVDLTALRQQCDQPCDLTTFYTNLASTQIELGPSFQWLAEVRQGNIDSTVQTVAKLVVPDAIGTVSDHLLHPGLLDACFRVAGLTQCNDARKQALAQAVLPFALGRLRLYRPAQGDTWWCHALQKAEDHWDIHLFDEQGMRVADIEGFQMRSATAEAVRGKDAWRDWLYAVEWQARPSFGLLPDYLPTPTSMIAALQKTAHTCWAEQADEAYQSLLNQLETLSVEYVVAAFAKAGFRLQAGTTWCSEQIARQIGVIPSYRRLLQRLLAMLAEAGILAQEAELWRVLHSPEVVNPALRVATLQAKQGNRPELLLLARCGEKLSEVLRGVQEPLELLFPGGDGSVAAQLYSESPTAQVMNRLVQQVVQNAVSHLPTGRGLRIVEIGAGTGGTTAGVLPLLPASQSEYHFTDLGTSFLHKAQTRFADYDFVRYQALDIEKAPTTQGFARHGADLVIAANVLHATKDLRETLTHVYQLLQPGGELVLLESVSPSRFVDLTFGLTDGWWRFADSRQTHPLLSATDWQTLLLANGFQAVEVVEQGGQAVIVAQTAVRQAQQPSAAAEPVVAESAGAWLIFADTQAIGQVVSEQLCQRGEKSILIYADACYRQADEQTLHIRPDCAEDYQRLLKTFPDVQGIVHLWSLDTPTLHAGMNLDAATQQSCGSVLHLVQALLQTEVKPSSLWLVTQNAQAVTATDAVQGVVQSGLWGMGKVIALEHPELNCLCIDLDATASAETQAARLCAELTAATHQKVRESQVALRQEARYVPRLTRFEPQPTSKLLCQPDATYLITGGLGGLGLATATWLAVQGATHLILMGRSQPTASVQTQLDGLTAQGVSVTVAQVDVTDCEQLQQLIKQIDPAYPLRGVIHSVGVLDDGVLLQQSWSRFVKVLAPKIQGAWHLHELTKEMHLDFFVLFSSVAGLLGSRGQANHAAANAFLDAFVHYRQAQGLPALSINWGAWSEIGAAAELVRDNRQQLAEHGMGVIAPQQGLAALAALLKEPAVQVGVLPIHWSAFFAGGTAANPFYASFSQPAEEQAIVPPTQSVSLRQQLAEADVEVRDQLLLQALRRAVAKVLGLRNPEQLDPRQGLLEMGLDSLMAIELRNHLARILEQQLPSTLIFDYPTLGGLNRYLQQEIVKFKTTDTNALKQRIQNVEIENATVLGNLSDSELDAVIDQELALLAN